jgi:FkbM family methyltransferase
VGRQASGDPVKCTVPPRAVRRAITWIRPGIRQDLQRHLKPLVARARTRRVVNAVYRRLTFKQWRSFNWFFSRLFTAGEVGEPGHWTVDFAGRRIVLPLGRESFPDDWERAASFLGHDDEVKSTYARLLMGPDPPDLFIDVGANFGTHSLMFLVHGIEAWSFEPNAACHERFRALCRLNCVEPHIIHAAVAERAGNATLSFPPGATWFGTIDPGVRDRIAEGSALTSETVRQTALDLYMPSMAGRRILLKIDAEGTERLVVAGARRMMEQLRPIVIFESTVADKHRAEILATFSTFGYTVRELPWPRRGGQALSANAFRHTRHENFIALPG